MQTIQSNITGGKKGFIAAIDAAFYGNGQRMHNPTIRYSHSNGFHVESGLTPADDDVIWSELAFYRANDGSQSIRPSEYNEVRAAILES